MKAFKLSNLAAVLLAGTAFATFPALSQEQGNTQTPPRILPQQGEQGGAESQSEGAGGAATQQDQNTGQTGAGANAETAQPSNESARDQAPGQRMQTGDTDTAREAAPGQRQNAGEVDSAKEAAPGQTKDDDQAAAPETSGETTASINISDEQKTEIRSVIVESDVEPVDVDIDVSVGVAVPETVELHPLPPRIVEIVPEYEGYMYFVLASGEIVIVDPDSHEVVYVIVA